MREDRIIPVFLITGFLESGKTSMISRRVKDQEFTRGTKTLVICCEEGIEEYDPAEMARLNVDVVVIDEPENYNARALKIINRDHRPERVIIEYNSMWGIEKLGATRLPPNWEFMQVITLADAGTFSNYMNNMRKFMTDPMKEADMIKINRCTPDFPKSDWRRQMRALNPNATILFENTDGSVEDGVRDEDLPYDMKADIVEIKEEDQGTFYLDSLDHPERYDGKTIRISGTPYPDAQLPENYYLFGREAMTCCSNDMQRVGWVSCGPHTPNAREYMTITAVGHKVANGDGSQVMLVLEEISMEKAPAPKEPYMTFGPNP